MSWIDDVGNGLKNAAGDIGEALIAAPGAVYDLATYITPGVGRGYGEFGGMLDSIGGRALDMVDPLGLGYDAGVSWTFSKTMEGLTWAYHEGIDQPLSTAVTMASHLDSGGDGETHYSDLFSGDAWSKAYEIAETQSLGQSVVYAVDNQHDPFEDTGITEEVTLPDGTIGLRALTPFEATAGKNNPFISNALAFSVDLAASWYLDPAAAAGKVAGLTRQANMGKISDFDRATFANKFDGASDALAATSLSKRFAPKSPEQRVESFIGYAVQNKLNGAEIRSVFPELKESANGRQLSALLADATKIEDHVERGNAVRRIVAIGAGDTTQVARLKSEVASAEAISNTLNNIIAGKTVGLTDQALNKALVNDPAFRLKFNQQLMAQDHAGDMTKFIDDWRAQVDSQITGAERLLATERGLDYVPTPGVRTDARLKATRGEGKLDKVERGHDKVFDRLNRFGQPDGYSAVYQTGLSSVPLIVAAPIKAMAYTLPTKLLPAAVRNLKQTHLTGYVNTHDWDGAVQQFDSMMKVGGVDNTTRLNLMSEAMKFKSAGDEAGKMGMIERVENETVKALATSLTQKFGIDVDAGFIRASMLEGHNTRAASMGSLGGGRQYAASTMQEGRLVDEATVDTFRAKGERRASLADDYDTKVAAERSARVDMFDDASGVAVAMPLVTPHLANRVPLFDIERASKLATDRAYVERLAKHSDAFKDEASRLTGLEAQLKLAKGSEADRIRSRIENVRKTQDWLLGVAGAFNRNWKMSVLFRLGYPMRVLADDHLRIAAKIGYMPFLRANVGEAVSNSLYNHLPGGAMRGKTRTGEARLAYNLARQKRDELENLMGRPGAGAHSDEEWDELNSLASVLRDGVSAPEVKAAASTRTRELDPDGYVQEYLDLKHQVAAKARVIGGHKGSITRWQSAEGVDNSAKVTAAEAKMAELQGELDQILMQMDGVPDPAALRQELTLMQESLRGGEAGFLPDKRHIGSKGVRLADGVEAKGAFDSTAHGYYEAVKSSDNFNAVLADGEETLYNRVASGHWRTVTPEDPGYYQLWANILNHQMQHSPEFMSIIRGGVKSPQEYAAWLAKSENKHIRDRVPHFAADPEDWGGRLLAVVQDYIPTQGLQELVAKGRVTPRDLRRMFPENATNRPSIHGQLADMQSGRIPGTRMIANGIGKAFSYLSEVPTDHLSRHPYFNAIYKQEVKAAYASKISSKTGGKFGQADLDEIERIARQRALHELKTTLWDVASHSHGAHVMRFLSPFFASHQEALTRWWGLAKNDPSIIRKFQLAFDAPRKAGLVVGPDGQPVEPGEAISAENRLVLKVPFASENSWVAKTVKDLGGGKDWEVNENGLNIILQSGVANPGVGPLVTIPLETFVQRYAESDKLEKAARILNAYPPAVPASGGNVASGMFEMAKYQLTPAWGKRLIATATGRENAEFTNSYMRNLADGLAEWGLAHPGQQPGRLEVKEIQERAKGEAHRDLMMMAATNLGFFTPAKPKSQYAAVQDGLNRIREQAEREGQDYEWVRDSFIEKYGPEYMAFLATKGTDVANLDSTKAEIGAMKLRRSVLDKIDPKLTRMVIGADAERMGDEDAALSVYSPAARSYLQGKQTGTGSGETYYGTKDLDEISLSMVAQQGWEQYDQLTLWLQSEADKMGLVSYEQSKQLSDIRTRALDYIKSTNEVFADQWSSYTPDNFDAQVDDMRLIAADPGLNKDSFRSQDMVSLQRYIELRDYVRYQMDQRGAKSLSDSPNSPNADLAQMMRQGVDYILSQSGDYFRQYSYSGIIERDPLLALASSYDKEYD